MHTLSDETDRMKFWGLLGMWICVRSRVSPLLTLQPPRHASANYRPRALCFPMGVDLEALRGAHAPQ